MDKREIFIAEHNGGMTMREIATKHGLSHQRVHQIIGGKTKNVKNWFKEITPEMCIYPNLRNWMNDNRITRAELCRRIWGYTQTNLHMRVSAYLTGETAPHKNTIDKLIEVTGLSYEELFTTDDER